MSSLAAELTKCLSCHQSFDASEFEIKRQTGKKKKFCKACCKKCSEAGKNGKLTEAHHRGRDYSERNEMLWELGFACYQDYLESSLWATVKELVYKKRDRICMLCGNPSHCLHHNRYHIADLSGKAIKFISPLCNSCHHALEFDGETKRTVKKVRALYVERRLAYLLSLPEGHATFKNFTKDEYITRLTPNAWTFVFAKDL